jgi:hypothetical protein
MRYWMTGIDGKVYGPFELERLRAMQVSGQLGSSAQLCAEGSQTWVAAHSVLGSLGAGVPSQAPPPAQFPMIQDAHPQAAFPTSVGTQWTPPSLVLPILVTVFCCLIGGIVSIVYTSQAKTKALQGNIVGAQSDARAANIWMIVSAVLGFVFVVFYIGLSVAANS